jgi:hypothetical protein
MKEQMRNDTEDLIKKIFYQEKEKAFKPLNSESYNSKV